MAGKTEHINRRLPLLIACLKINLIPIKKAALYTCTILRHSSHHVEHLFTRRVRDSDLVVLMHFHREGCAHKVYWNQFQTFVCNLQDMPSFRFQIWAPWANA